MSDSILKDKVAKEQEYYVVKNYEEQYSIWPTYKPIPSGWFVEGEPMPKEVCLDYIEKVWTDMRPLSLRKKMDSVCT